MPEEESLKNSNFNAVFGELEDVYRIRWGGEVIGIPLLLLVALVGGVFYYLDSRDWLTIPCCIAPSLLVLGSFVWSTVATRRDELRIYEKGFTYRSGKQLQTCLWTEIKTYRHRERKGYNPDNPNPDEFEIGSVEKKNGEQIAFDPDIGGTNVILRRYEKR